MNFIDKYKPKSVREIVGQEIAISQIKENLKKPLILYGPTGVGKTSVVHALVNDFNYEILELNASDLRNEEEINQIIGNAVRQQSLFKKSKLILVDELDGISGREDRGGVQALLKLINESKFPIIITVNDPWNSKFVSLRKKCKLLEFKKINYSKIFEVLKKICYNEGIKYEENDLKELARISNGDLRAAINDLEIISYNKYIKKEDILSLGEREYEGNIFNAIQLILKSDDPNLVLDSLNKSQCDLNESMLWLEENIPLEYKNKKDLYQALEYLSKADIFKGRISKWQYWRFLNYVNILLTAGIATSKKNKYYGFTKYKKPTRILSIWSSNQKNKIKKTISEKIAKNVHISIKKANKDFYIYKNFITKNSINELNLNEEEIEFLNIK